MGKNLKLVDCKPKYWEFVRKLRTDPNNQKGFFTNVAITKEQQKNYMEDNSDKYKICLLENQPVGYIGVPSDSKIVYCVDYNHQGNGIGTYMLKNFKISNLRLEAHVLPDNTASQKAFEKAGYEKIILYKQPEVNL